ncbi:hypothetical protein C8F04DRAFT_1123901 [Mycena alexandri]|uniref:Uncharacterized protein n=1 Tax=Mycena alexandri TaxID=1745969 RepID=A0AAD6SFS8_9AGAR|nr:hypothetical protein C8F04DRAFT_1123901 [Mycena alexandri]
METPEFWSTVILDTTAWPRSITAAMPQLGLVTAALNRSKECLLTMSIAIDPEHPAEETILRLLGQHSHRWKEVDLVIDPQSWNFLASSKGNFPLLDKLNIVCAGDSDGSKTNDTFKIAPRLKSVRIMGWSGALPEFAWKQLRDFVYENWEGDIFSLEMLRSLSGHASCEFLLTTSEIPADLDLAPVTASISALILTLVTDPDPLHAKMILGAIFEALTFSGLTSLHFPHYPARRPPWNQTHFLKFASRSSLSKTLTSLDLCVVIERQELLACLSILPLLEFLRLSDDEYQATDHHLITDDLLRSLTWKPDHSNLVPHLKTLHLESLIHFRDAALLQSITSRVEAKRSSKGLFKLRIHYLPGYDREVSVEFVSQAAELGLVLTIDHSYY